MDLNQNHLWKRANLIINKSENFEESLRNKSLDKDRIYHPKLELKDLKIQKPSSEAKNKIASKRNLYTKGIKNYSAITISRQDRNQHQSTDISGNLLNPPQSLLRSNLRKKKVTNKISKHICWSIGNNSIHISSSRRLVEGSTKVKEGWKQKQKLTLKDIKIREIVSENVKEKPKFQEKRGSVAKSKDKPTTPYRKYTATEDECFLPTEFTTEGVSVQSVKVSRFNDSVLLTRRIPM